VSPGNVVLIGFMGSGKTTVGRILAQRLGWDFIDTDALVESRAEARIAEIFRSKGERAFRESEKRVLAELGTRSGLIVATGGGAPAQIDNRTFFSKESSAVFHLRVSLETALQRTRNESPRPLLMQTKQAIHALYESRLPLYEELGIPVETEGRSAAEVAEQIMKLLGSPSR
jgi:shikimate kinase